MTDRVAGKTADAKELYFWRFVSAAQGCNVGLTEAVYLTGSYQRVTRTAPNIVKNASKTHPVLVGLSFMGGHTAHGIRTRQHIRLTIGHHHVGIGCPHRETGCQSR